ncbi:MAG: hypothetical protein ABI454_01360 [Sphingomicrobium sp.]
MIVDPGTTRHHAEHGKEFVVKRNHKGPIFAASFIFLIASCGSAQAQQSMENMGSMNVAQPAPAVAQPSNASPPVVVPPLVCPADHPFDPGMKMCMTNNAKPMPALTFSLNQFAVYSTTSGPRGHSRVTGPGVWMLMYNQALSSRNTLRVNVMGTAEQLTVGQPGTPQLFQTENIDNMHPHDYLMAVEFRDVVKLGADDKQELTFLFAPRGAAAIGPVPFMHRASAEGNPDAPLGHGLQDGFHDVSTVVGVAYRNSGTTVEATAFSGHAISWPLPLHNIDSYGARVIQKIDDHVSIGASYADVLTPDDAGGAGHEKFVAGWLATSHKFHGATLKSSFIWGRVRAGQEAALNSFLAEAVYQRRMNKIYGRAESLQITPGQLDLVPLTGSTDAKWVKALTLGYERTLVEKGPFSMFAGGSFTKDFAPMEFRPDYGSDPRGAKLYFRIKIGGPSGMRDGM